MFVAHICSIYSVPVTMPFGTIGAPLEGRLAIGFSFVQKIMKTSSQWYGVLMSTLSL